MVLKTLQKHPEAIQAIYGCRVSRLTPFTFYVLCALPIALSDYRPGWFCTSSKVCVPTEFPINCELYWLLSNVNLAAHHRPARPLVKFVVLVFPRGAAAVTKVAGDRDQMAVSRLLPVAALQQLGMAGRATPVALDARAGFAKGHFLQFVFRLLWRCWCVVVGHLNLLSLLTTDDRT